LQTIRTRSTLLGAITIFLLAAALIWPLFRLKYMANWSSIESTFIADAHLLRQNWNLSGWQPLWYCGTRNDYIYPPALRVGTALISLYPRMTTARAYHIYIAAFYCVGILGVYALALVLFRRQAIAWVCGAAAAVLSPSFLFLPRFRDDCMGAFLLPMRLNVLIRYGEGPHMSSFAILPLALAASWYAVGKGRGVWMAAAAVLSALVVSNNFYGATALAIFFPILCWSLWLTSDDWKVWPRAAAIGLLAYGLTAFWLTPSYLRITLDNMRLVAKPGNSWSPAVALVTTVVFGFVSWVLARRRPDRAAAVFLAGSFVLFTLNTVGNYYWDFRVIGEPLRLVPEWDLVLILCTAGVLFWAQRRYWPTKAGAAALTLVVLALFVPAKRYVRHAWQLYPQEPDPTSRVEYQITDWLAREMPDSRVHVTGSVRFWFNSWHDNAQIGGGSEQGVLNGNIIPAFWEFVLGPDPEPTVLWLRALGSDAIVVNDPNSQEIYHDHQHPHKLDGVLPVVYDDGAGNRIYRAPRRFPDRARVVSTAALASAMPEPVNGDQARLKAYVDVVEHGPDSRAEVIRLSSNRMRIRARVEPGQSVLVQESFDPAWRAEAGGKSVPIRADGMGFLVLDAPAGNDDIDLHFDLPLENRVGRGITLVTLAILIVLIVRPRRASV
jgi:hypothetical protein